jgi:hypothetical protein
MSLSGKSNINPRLWGPYFWETIHFVAHGYPDNPNDTDKRAYKSFYRNMMKVLPCDKCANSAQTLFSRLKIEPFLNSRNDLIRWTHSFHSAVNDKLGKKSPSLEEFMHNFTNREEKGFKKYINYGLLIAIIILISILIIRYTLNNL